MQTDSLIDPVIGFIGAGRLGTALGLYFGARGLRLAGYASRTRASALQAAAQTSASIYEHPEDVANESDVLFLTVPDRAISPVWDQLKKAAQAGTLSLEGKWIIHCSGSLSTDILSNIRETGAKGYSVHPIMAVSDPVRACGDFPGAVFTVQAADGRPEEVIGFLQNLGLTALPLAADQKTRYHAACVMASNLVCGLYAAAQELLVTCGFDQESAGRALAPLFLANARAVAQRGPAAALTGPVQRGDMETVNRHIADLEQSGLDLDLEVYQVLTDRIMALKKNGK